MRFLILLPGKIKPKVLLEGQVEYTRRLKLSGVEVLEYKDEKVSSHTVEQTKQAEAERIFKYLKADDYLIACDERGTSVQTTQVVELLRTARQGGGVLAGKRRVVIVIGGALGLAESVRQRADLVWALSSLVMAGGVARIVLLEGLYRAFSIVEGHPYHNE